MRKEAILINCARGPIVDEDALVKSLEEGLIGGAALDVFEVEPLPADSPLLQMNNVLLAPHNSNSSPAAWERVNRNTIKNLIEALGMPFDERMHG
jgi:D-3-phosphoglycerate dehydrogenase